MAEHPPGGAASAAVPAAPPTGPAHWLGPDLVEAQWTRAITEGELADMLTLAQACDLEDAESLAGFDDGSDGAPESLVGLAAEVRDALLNGLGFAVVTGLPVDELDQRTIAAAYVTFGRLLGGLRSQNADGHLLGHVRNVGADPSKPTTRIYQTDRRQTFHTDSCDAVGLLCLTPALEGGESLLVSTEAVYRIMFERDPALATRLFDPVATDRRGEVPPGQKPWFEIPVLSWFDDRLTALYQRQYVDSARRFPNAPVPDEEQIRALDLFDSILDDPAVHLSVRFAPGDMQFVNNHALLHDRTGFVDDPASPRHLLRLWLALPNARQLPPIFTQRYGSVTVGDRGGIVTEGTRPTISLHP